MEGEGGGFLHLLFSAHPSDALMLKIKAGIHPMYGEAGRAARTSRSERIAVESKNSPYPPLYISHFQYTELLNIQLQHNEMMNNGNSFNCP